MQIAKKAYTSIVAMVLDTLPAPTLAKFSDELLRLRHRSQEIVRQRNAVRTPDIAPVIRSYDDVALTRSILAKHPPWADAPLGSCRIPGMLSDAERRYYGHISKFYSALGEVVELGPWLGLSTHYLLNGLLRNPHFKGRKLYVYDDFTWRSSWMNKWLTDTGISAPANHSSFEHLFTDFTRDLAEHIIPAPRKLCDYEGNEALPLLDWPGRPIELLVVDCGRHLAVNESWWNLLSGCFLKDRTIIVMQDWQNCKNVPEQFWENTKLFTDSKVGRLDLIHEVGAAGIATFLYRGDP